ncbi:MAG: LamG domain-containing protein [Bacteroidetes bacterium]|nr:LamG domain-containing protein [Bacteroidota bacterium]
MKTIKPTLLAAAMLLAAALSSCRKDANPTPAALLQRNNLSLDSLSLCHFNKKDPKRTLSEGLLAYYPFSGNANDWSGNGYNGVVTGATLTKGKSGGNNSAYSFNGTSDYITFPFSYGSDTTQFSIYARIKRGANGTIFSKGERRRTDQVVMSVSSDSASVNLNIYWQRAVPSVAHITVAWVSGTQMLKQHDRWEDLVVTLNYPELKAYINGKLVISGPMGDYSFLFGDFNGKPLIGATQEGYIPSRDMLTGVIDEMRFYTRPLTQEEIDYLYKH